jgi:hypothetical protein
MVGLIFGRAGKRGIFAFNLVIWIVRIITLVFVLIACVILVRMFLLNKIDVKDVQAEIMVGGLLYSQGGVGYYDSLTGRNYPEIIDLSQLDSAEIDRALYYPDNKLITARISVLDADKNDVFVYYYNKKWWDNWEPLLKLSLPGIGGVTKYERTLPVIYQDSKNGIRPKMGYVKYEVVQPRG